MLEQFDAKDIRTRGAVIHLRTGGSGPPLLLLHGYPQTLVMWHKIMPELARKHTVVAADLRGYGDSSSPPGGDRHGVRCRVLSLVLPDPALRPAGEADRRRSAIFPALQAGERDEGCYASHLP
jgi:pimeloyl-ACP methyl ester carboxylesterase